MAWFTPSDLLERLPQKQLAQLSTGEGRPDAADDAVLQACLDRAEQDVRGLLAGRATLPGTLEEGALRNAVLDLAVEKLFLRQPGQAAKVPDAWRDIIKASRAYLLDLVEGRSPIPSVSNPVRLIAAVSVTSQVDAAFGRRCR